MAHYPPLFAFLGDSYPVPGRRVFMHLGWLAPGLVLENETTCHDLVDLDHRKVLPGFSDTITIGRNGRKL
jgi:hypothetical protein